MARSLTNKASSKTPRGTRMRANNALERPGNTRTNPYRFNGFRPPGQLEVLDDILLKGRATVTSGGAGAGGSPVPQVTSMVPALASARQLADLKRAFIAGVDLRFRIRSRFELLLSPIRFASSFVSSPPGRGYFYHETAPEAPAAHRISMGIHFEILRSEPPSG